MEDQDGLDAAVGEEKPLVELGQALAVAHGLSLSGHSATRNRRGHALAWAVRYCDSRTDVMAWLHNPVTGEVARINVTPADTDGRRIEVDLWLQPGAAVPRAHIHDRLVERYEVLAGEVGFQLGPDERIARSGDPAVEVPAGTLHDWWNAGDGIAQVRFSSRRRRTHPGSRPLGSSRASLRCSRTRSPRAPLVTAPDGQPSPRSRAHSAACVRSVTPMRSKMWVRWPLTVRSLMASRRAISLFGRPCASERRAPPPRASVSCGSGAVRARSSSSRAARGCSGACPRAAAWIARASSSGSTSLSR